MRDSTNVEMRKWDSHSSSLGYCKGETAEKGEKDTINFIKSQGCFFSLKRYLVPSSLTQSSRNSSRDSRRRSSTPDFSKVIPQVRKGSRLKGGPLNSAPEDTADFDEIAVCACCKHLDFEGEEERESYEKAIKKGRRGVVLSLEIDQSTSYVAALATDKHFRFRFQAASQGK